MGHKTRKAGIAYSNNAFIRYKKNPGYYNHREYFNNLKNAQNQRELNGDYNIKRVPVPSGYELQFEDDFNGNTLDNQKWGTGFKWGTFYGNPEFHGYYFPIDGLGPSGHSTIRVENGILKLDCISDTKQFDINNLGPRDVHRQLKLLKDCRWGNHYSNNPLWDIEFNAGAVFSKESWQQGWFEAEIKLPINKHMWCAFWLEGVQFWPPEIDVFEAFTDDDDHYINPVPNIHFGNNNNANSPDQSYRRAWYKPNLEYNFVPSDPDPMKLFAAPYRFVQFAVHWTSDFVKIFYDGELYREYDSDDLPPLYNDPDISMRIVLNNGVTNYYDNENDFGDDKPYESSTMYIDNVRVYQKP